MANWTDFSEESYLPAMRTALIWQGVIGVLALLVLDGGQTWRAFGAAFLCHWSIIWILLFRRPLAPTRVDLALVRYATLPLLVLILACGPTFLRLIGTPSDFIR